MAAFGDSELAATKMEVISERVQRQLIAQSVLVPTVRDLSAFAKKGAESVSFPKGGDFTVNQRASGAQAVQQVFNYEKDTMLLDFRSTISWVVDSMDEIESVINVQSDLISRATKGHAKDVDLNIIAELELVGVPTTTAGDISKTIILEMRQALLSREADPGALTLAIGPDSEAIMLDIPDFVRADAYGNSRIPSGTLGSIYGMNTVLSTQLAASQYFMYEADGCGIAFQRAARLDSRKAPEFGTGSQLFVMDQKYGIKGLEIAAQGVGAAESALVQRDNNV